MVFLCLLGVPVVLAILAFIFLDGITWKEFLLLLAAEGIVAGTSAAVVYYSDTSDSEVWNGSVSSKTRDQVSCTHSHECNCKTDKKGHRTCKTCYDHSYDVEWHIHTTNGETLTIDHAMFDAQGTTEPSRWSSAQVGEPTAVTHTYTSYIKASPGTLFRHQGNSAKYKGKLPNYPGDIFDYYRLNRLVLDGVSVDNTQAWNEDIAKLNAELGRTKQANIMVVLTSQPSEDWYFALEEQWMGGKKNDIALVVGVDTGMKPQWAHALAWSKHSLFQIKLRDDILDDPAVTRESVLAALRANVSANFERKPMKDFEYLKSSITPSGLEWGISMFIGLLVASGLIWLFQVKDVFGDEGRSSYGSGFSRGRSFKRY